MKKRFLFLFLVLSALSVFPQNSEDVLPLPDSLVGKLKEYNRLDTKRAEVLVQVVMFYYDQAMAKDRNLLEEGEFYIKELEALANATKDRFWLAASKHYYGLYALERYEYGECILYNKEALHIAETLPKGKGTERLIAEIYVTLSGCYADWNMPLESIECIEKGLPIAKKIGFSKGQLALLTNKGSVLFNMDRYRECIETYKQLGKERIDYIGIWNTAQAYFELNMYDSALVYCDTLLHVDDSKRVAIETEHLIGSCHLKMNQLDEAERCYLNAYELAKTYNDAFLSGHSLWLLANVYLEKGSYENASKLVDSAIIVLSKTNDHERLRHSYKLKSDIMHAMQYYEAEAENLRLFFNITDSITKIQNIEQVDKMIIQKEIADMDAQYQAEKDLLRQRSRYLLLLACSIAAFSAIVVVLLLKNKKQKEALLQQELELRNREITAKTMGKMQSNEMLSEVIEKLTEKERNPEKNVLPGAIRDLKSMLDADAKKDFDLHFVQVHPNFYENLMADFPNLTVNDLRLCAFIKSNLNTKDIAALNNMSADSVKNARSRLRKKLGLTDPDVSLLGFLSRY